MNRRGEKPEVRAPIFGLDAGADCSRNAAAIAQRCVAVGADAVRRRFHDAVLDSSAAAAAAGNGER